MGEVIAMTWPFGALEPGGFACVLADPPWKFKSYTEHVGNRSVENHYRTMTLKEIAFLPVEDLAARDAHLFLWTTGPSMESAFGLIRAWGFRYSGIAFTWIKLKKSHDPNQLRVLPTAAGDFHVGMGFTTRKNAEFCLLARRGNARRLDKTIRELIIAPRREHSRKPEETYGRIERYCAGPRVELFGRQQRSGWSVWGDEANKFDAVS